MTYISADRAPCLYIVVPCYNEQEALLLSCEVFLDKLAVLMAGAEVSRNSKIVFIDDGSTDSTWQIISGLAASRESVEGIKLSRNRGHQNALLAGLMTVRTLCDITISIDCDGQDDIDAIDEMMAAYKEGNEIVYGVRSDRSTDSFFKRETAEGFYKLMKKMGVEEVFNHADYRLMSSCALDALSKYEEVNLYLRGMVPLLGYRSATVSYERKPRVAGESHYPLSKMVALAVDGITSFSIKPIRLISITGFVISAFSIVGILWVIAMHITGNVVAGWASTLCAVLLLGGLQLTALGIIGEYVGRIYLETKHRPRYQIEQSTFVSKV